MISANQAHCGTVSIIERETQLALDTGMPKILKRIKCAISRSEFQTFASCSVGERQALITLNYEVSIRNDFDGTCLISWDKV